MEDEKDSFRWCSATEKRTPKQITCRLFFAKVISLMNWDPNKRYKLLGKLIKSGDEYLFLFDLNNPEIFERSQTEDSSKKSASIPMYPESWKHQFGVPVSEHKKAMQVNFLEDYAIFGLQKDHTKTKETIIEPTEVIQDGGQHE